MDSLLCGRWAETLLVAGLSEWVLPSKSWPGTWEGCPGVGGWGRLEPHSWSKVLLTGRPAGPPWKS